MVKSKGIRPYKNYPNRGKKVIWDLSYGEIVRRLATQPLSPRGPYRVKNEI